MIAQRLSMPETAETVVVNDRDARSNVAMIKIA